IPEPFRAAEEEDIDSLYKQSLAETVELPRSFRLDPPVLGDAGMDDDMIEMSYGAATAEGSETREFEFVTPVEPESFESAQVSELEPVELEIPHETPSWGHDSYTNFDDTLPAINYRPVDVGEKPRVSLVYDQPETHPAQSA